MISITINKVEYKFTSLDHARMFAACTPNGFNCLLDDWIMAARELVSYFYS